MTGDVDFTGKLCEGGTELSSTYRKWNYARVGLSGASAEVDPYFKFAEISTSANAVDPWITFKVNRGYGDSSTCVGILTAHFRTTSNGTWYSGELMWEYAASGIDTSKFILAHNTDEAPCCVELWAVVDTGYASYHFEVMAEGNRINVVNTTPWTLYQVCTESGESEITADYTQVESTLGTLKNDISGNAAAAAKLATARTIQTNLASTSSASFDGSANTSPGVTGTLPLTNGGTGATTAPAARTNLGLGDAATYGVTTSVTSESSNLVTSGAVYTAINTLEESLEASAYKGFTTTVTQNSTSLITSGAVYTALQGLATANIVIAASDTDDTLKARANYTCTGTSDQTIINTAIASLSSGGKVVLLPGTYTLSGYINIYVSNIWLCGCGNSTIIQADPDSKCCIDIYGDYIKVSDLSTINVPIETNIYYTTYPALYTVIENIVATYSNSYAIIIYGVNSPDEVLNNYVRILNVTTICTDTETAVCALNIQNRKTICIGCIGYDADGTESQSDYVGDNVTFVGCVGYETTTETTDDSE